MSMVLDKRLNKIFISRSSHLEFDIVFLQGTHVTNIVEASKFSKLREGKMSFGTTKSCRMGISQNKILSFKLVSQVRDTDGRLLCLDIKLADRRYRPINVYIQNDAANRKHFIYDLEGYLITPREIILGGDFNFVDHIEREKMGGNLQRGDDRAAKMGLLKDDFFLVDVFRTNFQKKGVYSA